MPFKDKERKKAYDRQYRATESWWKREIAVQRWVARRRRNALRERNTV